ncbi:MAG: RluA family pseudouridine synthase [Bacteroidales bacterium]|nr:RluA family pseudouridine synthase [Bacteroidales bacterium]
MEWKVEKKAELLEFLMEKMEGSSRTKMKETLARNVMVDGRKVTQYNFPLMEGMTVTVGKADFKKRWTPRDVDIVYEDQWLLVVNKREGLVSYSRKAGDVTMISEVNGYLEATRQKCHAHVVHRLDRDTSGLMVVAKSKEVARKFEENWKERVYDRKYVAVVWGKLEVKEGVIRSWLTDGEYCVLSSWEDNGGKEAVTRYRVVKESRRYTMVDLKLDTGRRNQIRVHAREIGHPVVKDPMYGYKDDISPINRLALHAYRLCFFHPVTGKKMEYETEVPKSFEKLMEI